MNIEKYLNKSGNSPITHYQINLDKITVWFEGGKNPYSYSNRKAGITHVSKMKLLAEKGSGLSSYISKNVRKLYE